jgi:hypothetical protein
MTRLIIATFVSATIILGILVINGGMRAGDPGGPNIRIAGCINGVCS